MTHPIKKYLDEHNMTAADFAFTLAITPSALSQIIHGRCRVSAEMAAQIERVHGIPAEVFRPDVFRGLTAKK